MTKTETDKKQAQAQNRTMSAQNMSLKEATAYLMDTVQHIHEGGPQNMHKKHADRGKLFVRDRIQLLLDEGSAFIELSTLAGLGVYQEEVPCAGLVTGIGRISSHLCMIIANDATVKGGTYYPITVKKHLRAQEIAQENFLPCLYLVDSGGANLPHQAEVFPDKEHFGRMFFNSATMSSMGIPQIAIVMGSCTAGGAYIPAMADQTIMVGPTATIFLAGPPLVEVATGEKIDAHDLGGAAVHIEHSGLADYYADNDEDALRICRDILKHIPHISRKQPMKEVISPKYTSCQLDTLLNDGLKQVDIRDVIYHLVDNSEIHEFKPNYGRTLVTCFSFIHGYEVGIIANNGILFSESALKGTHFIQLCEQRNIPIIFLQNVTGFMVGSKYEKEGIAKHGAKMVTAVATAKVPKYTIILESSFGAGNYGMCGRAFQPRFLWTWPNAEIAVMGGLQAANVLTKVQQKKFQHENIKWDASIAKDIHDKIMQTYEHQSSVFYGSARLWDDGVIPPHKTRDILGLTLGLEPEKSEAIKKSWATNGVFRM